ncbi:alpha/beta fold hydrolase [Streptomyces sp. NPDC050433]|uniref:alpha/beta fold hydrolase n=1 Tax=Streptomyces sp. NPDC050433 TaxID=3365615 RepID=UPI0037B7E666
MTTAMLPHHSLDGRADAPLLVLGPSLGTSMTVWDPYVANFAQHFRVLRYDLPGHGGTPSAPLAGPQDGSGAGRTTVADLASHVLDLVDHHGAERFHYIGISLGGVLGACLASRHPQRVASLALVCSSAHFGPPEPWQERAALVRREGTAALIKAMPDRWFAHAGTADTSFGKDLLRSLAAAESHGYAACCDALATCDLRASLAGITAPTLVVGGSHDTATPLHHARELAEGIPGATLRTVAAGHLAVEDPEALSRVLNSHLHTAGTNSTPA